MKNKIKKLVSITTVLAVCSSFSVASNINNDYMNKFEENTFYSILGGGGGASDYYQMMTYYEMITLNANQLKQFNNDLEQMRVYLEQIKKLQKDLKVKKKLLIISTLIATQLFAKTIDFAWLPWPGNMLFWRMLHGSAARLTFIAAGVHLGLHWKWIVCQFKKVEQGCSTGCGEMGVAPVERLPE